jgi:hypothetical protein
MVGKDFDREIREMAKREATGKQQGKRFGESLSKKK